jgi:hypothetical protein
MEALLSSMLSRNTTSIIIGYLTDLPHLPFIFQLQNKTLSIHEDTSQFWFYRTYFTNSLEQNVDFISKIRYDEDDCRWTIECF